MAIAISKMLSRELHMRVWKRYAPFFPTADGSRHGQPHHTLYRQFAIEYISTVMITRTDSETVYKLHRIRKTEI